MTTPAPTPTDGMESPTLTPPIENQKSKIENAPNHPHPLLPIDHLTLLLGDPGVGKSLLAIDIASRLTNNSLPAPHPHLPRPAFPSPADDIRPNNFQPATVIYLSAEDSPHTLRQRFDAAGADEDRTRLPPEHLPLHHRDETRHHPQFVDGLKRGIPTPPLVTWLIESLLEFDNPRLVILDPLPSFLGLKDCSNAAVVRRLLDPLLSLAAKHHFSILGLTHLTKSPRRFHDNLPDSPLYRTIGSLAYSALARSVLYLQPDPNDKNRRILHQLKNNLGELSPSLAFSLRSLPQSPPTLDWEPAPLEAPNPFHNTPAPPPDPFLKSQLDDAIDFLKTALAAGPLHSAQLLKEARSLGISQRTLARARFLLHTHSHRDHQTMCWFTTLAQPTPPPVSASKT